MKRTLAALLLVVAAVVCWSLLQLAPEEGAPLPAGVRQRFEATQAPSPQPDRMALAEEQESVLEKGAELTILVRSQAREPVEGVEATLYREGSIRRFEQEAISDRDGMLRWSLPTSGSYRFEIRSHLAGELRPPHEATMGRDPEMVFDWPAPSRGPPGVSGLIQVKAGDSIHREVTVYQPTRVRGQLALTGPLAAPAVVFVAACGPFTRGTLKGHAKLQETEIQVAEPGSFELVLTPGDKSLSAVWQHGNQVMLVTRNFQVLEGQTLDLGQLAPRHEMVTELALRFDDGDTPLRPLAAIGAERPVVWLTCSPVDRASLSEGSQYDVKSSGERWTLIGLTPGKWQFCARLQNLDPPRGIECPDSATLSTLVPVTSPVELTFAVKSRAALSVLGIAPEPGARITLQIFAMNLETQEVVQADGYADYAVELLVDPGRHLIWMTTQRYGVADDANLYAEGEVAVSPRDLDSPGLSVELLLVPARRWEGRATRTVDAKGRKVTTVQFNIAGFPETAAGLVVVELDGEDRVLLTGVPPHREPVPIPGSPVRWD